MAKKIVAMVGSYRKDRVIDTAVSEILKGAEAHGAQTTKIYLIDKHIEFCRNCRTCTQEKDVGRRGKCAQDDDMNQILQEIDSADGLVLASPTNFFNVTAVTRRFIERLLPYAYWPWGAKMGPTLRIKKLDKKAVIVTSTACPAWLARIVIRAPSKALKIIARCVGAKVVQSLHFGSVAQSPDSTLSQRSLLRAYEAGEKLAL